MLRRQADDLMIISNGAKQDEFIRVKTREHSSIEITENNLGTVATLQLAAFLLLLHIKLVLFCLLNYPSESSYRLSIS